MRRARLFFFILTILVVLGGGMPVAAIITSWMNGTGTVVFNAGLPGEYTAISGVDAPRPAWIPIHANARVTDGFQVISGSPDRFGLVDLVVAGSLDEIKAYYSQSLAEIGFSVVDHGIAPLNEATAKYLGVAGTLVATRPESGDFDYVAVQIRSADSWFTSARVVSVQWSKWRPEDAAATAPKALPNDNLQR